MLGNRGIYHEGWMVCTKHGLPWVLIGRTPAFGDDGWELCGPEDWTPGKKPGDAISAKTRRTSAALPARSVEIQCLPLDDRKAERLTTDLAGQPDLMKGRTSMTLYPGDDARQ
jgi:hypothetical protein